MVRAGLYDKACTVPMCCARRGDCFLDGALRWACCVCVCVQAEASAGVRERPPRLNEADWAGLRKACMRASASVGVTIQGGRGAR